MLARTMSRISKPSRVSVGFLLLLVLLFAAACSSASGLSEGDQAPGFELATASGKNVALSDYVGKQPVLLFFHMALG